MEISLISKKELDIVAGSFLFEKAGYDAAKLAIIDERCVLREYSKGDIVFDTDAYSRSLGFVLSGSLDVIKPSPGGGSYVMNVIKTGGAFGVAALFNDSSQYVSRLISRGKSRLLFFPQELLSDVMRGNFAVAESYITFLSGRIQFLNSKIEGLVIPGTGMTLRHYLSSNARQVDGKNAVALDVPLSQLAEMLHMGRASLYRSFDALEAEGIIKRSGRIIEIIDMDRLIPDREELI